MVEDSAHSKPGGQENPHPGNLSANPGQEIVEELDQPLIESHDDKSSDKSSVQQAVPPTDRLEPGAGKRKEQDSEEHAGWQERLLPLMSGLLLGLTLFFFLATFIQISYMHWSILRSPTIDINPDADVEVAASAGTFNERLEARQQEVLNRIETYMVEQRYHHALVLIMSGLWLRYMGFVTGMIVALVGASFVLGKLRESPTEVKGKLAKSGEFSLISASPGIILVVLGVLLMFTTIIDRDYYEVKDAPVYINSISTPFLPTEVPVEEMRPLDMFQTPFPNSEETPIP